MLAIQLFIKKANINMQDKKPWNKGKIVGKKPPLTPEQVNIIRYNLTQEEKWRDLALFNIAIDSGLRGSDLLKLKVEDVIQGGEVKEVIRIKQQKTGETVSFSLSEISIEALQKWLKIEYKYFNNYIFTPLKGNNSQHISTEQFRRLFKSWLSKALLDPKKYGTHSLRRTQSSHIYKQTGNLRAAQLLLGHQNIKHTAEYLGIEEEQALDIAKKYRI